MIKLLQHIKMLKALKWNHYTGHHYTTAAVDFIKDEVNFIAGVLLSYKDWRGLRENKKKSGGGDDSTKTPPRGGVVAAF